MAKKDSLDIFDRQRIKTNLMNRVMRALRDCPDDAMRLEMLTELASMTKLIGALDGAGTPRPSWNRDQGAALEFIPNE